MQFNRTYLSRIIRLAALWLCLSVWSASMNTAAFAQAAAAPVVPAASPASDLWVTAYYISGDADSGRLPVSKIDFGAITHLIHFCLFPNADGTLRDTITPAQSQTILAAAHAAGVKVLVSLGTDDGAKGLHSAVSPAHRATLVKNLVQFVMTRGYDGLDLDYEPVEDADVPAYTLFVTDLRLAMNAAKPGLLLSAAVASEPGLFNVLQNDFDQLNLMTYDLSGQYQDFKSWYNSNLFGDPSQSMEKGEPYPSCDDMVKQFTEAGVPRSKLAVGIAFYGYVWSGISGPRQTIQGLKGLTIDDGADYRMIVDKFYQPSRYRWDQTAMAPYLTIDAPLPQDRKFISYDDERLCTAKVAYARQQKIGGVMIWELGGGYADTRPEGSKDSLLQAVKRARLDPSVDDPRAIGPVSTVAAVSK